MNYSSLKLYFHDDLTLKGEMTYRVDGEYCFLLDSRFMVSEIRDKEGRNVTWREEKIKGRPILGAKTMIKIEPPQLREFTIFYQTKKPYANPASLSPWKNRYNAFDKNKITLDDAYIVFYPALNYCDISRARVLERPQCLAEAAELYGLKDFKLLNSQRMYAAPLALRITDTKSLLSASAPFLNIRRGQ